MRFLAKILVVSASAVCCALPSSAQTVLTTNNVIFNFAAILQSPSQVTSISISTVQPLIANGIAYSTKPPALTRANDAAQITNGYAIFTNLLCGMACTVTINDTYSSITTNFTITPPLFFDANSNVVGFDYIGPYVRGIGQFYSKLSMSLALATFDTNGAAAAAVAAIPASKLVNMAGQQTSLTNPANAFTGTFAGNGSGLTFTNLILSKSNLQSGFLSLMSWGASYYPVPAFMPVTTNQSGILDVLASDKTHPSWMDIGTWYDGSGSYLTMFLSPGIGGYVLEKGLGADPGLPLLLQPPLGANFGNIMPCVGINTTNPYSLAFLTIGTGMGNIWFRLDPTGNNITSANTNNNGYLSLSIDGSPLILNTNTLAPVNISGNLNVAGIISGNGSNVTSIQSANIVKAYLWAGKTNPASITTGALTNWNWALQASGFTYSLSLGQFTNTSAGTFQVDAACDIGTGGASPTYVVTNGVSTTPANFNWQFTGANRQGYFSGLVTAPAGTQWTLGNALAASSPSTNAWIRIIQIQ